MSSLVPALLTASAIIATAPVRAHDAQPRTCDGTDRLSCHYILDATEAFTTMLVTADPSPLRRHLDPQALWISPDGDVRSGAQLIDTVRRDTRRAVARLDQAHVRFFGPVAIVTWEESWIAPGAPVKAGRLAGVDTWVKRGRTWKIVSTAEIRMKP